MGARLPRARALELHRRGGAAFPGARGPRRGGRRLG
jgi:hypothetical protein